MESKPTTYLSGTTHWQLPDGRYHRIDGPAVIFNNGSQYWCKFNKLHRLDGPAITYKNGNKKWYINDHDVSIKINEWANDMNIDLDNLTDEDKFMIRLYWENYSE